MGNMIMGISWGVSCGKGYCNGYTMGNMILEYHGEHDTVMGISWGISWGM